MGVFSPLLWILFPSVSFPTMSLLPCSLRQDAMVIVTISMLFVDSGIALPDRSVALSACESWTIARFLGIEPPDLGLSTTLQDQNPEPVETVPP
eukprot:m.37312 g.37312  ORF g.37312 m.37312 type:complete len:94 (+) comp7677_c0_seq1:1082-1363(+)